MDLNKLFTDAAQDARLRAGGHGRLSTEPTHFISFDQPRVSRGQQRAICGALVDSDSHAVQPSCRACREKQADLESLSF